MQRRSLPKGVYRRDEQSNTTHNDALGIRKILFRNTPFVFLSGSKSRRHTLICIGHFALFGLREEELYDLLLSLVYPRLEALAAWEPSDTPFQAVFWCFSF